MLVAVITGMLSVVMIVLPYPSVYTNDQLEAAAIVVVRRRERTRAESARGSRTRRSTKTQFTLQQPDKSQHSAGNVLMGLYKPSLVQILGEQLWAECKHAEETVVRPVGAQLCRAISAAKFDLAERLLHRMHEQTVDVLGQLEARRNVAIVLRDLEAFDSIASIEKLFDARQRGDDERTKQVLASFRALCTKFLLKSIGLLMTIEASLLYKDRTVFEDARRALAKSSQECSALFHELIADAAAQRAIRLARGMHDVALALDGFVAALHGNGHASGGRDNSTSHGSSRLFGALGKLLSAKNLTEQQRPAGVAGESAIESGVQSQTRPSPHAPTSAGSPDTTDLLDDVTLQDQTVVFHRQYIAKVNQLLWRGELVVPTDAVAAPHTQPAEHSGTRHAWTQPGSGAGAPASERRPGGATGSASPRASAGPLAAPRRHSIFERLRQSDWYTAVIQGMLKLHAGYVGVHNTTRSKFERAVHIAITQGYDCAVTALHDRESLESLGLDEASLDVLYRFSDGVLYDVMQCHGHHLEAIASLVNRDTVRAQEVLGQARRAANAHMAELVDDMAKSSTRPLTSVNSDTHRVAKLMGIAALYNAAWNNAVLLEGALDLFDGSGEILGMLERASSCNEHTMLGRFLWFRHNTANERCRSFGRARHNTHARA